MDFQEDRFVVYEKLVKKNFHFLEEIHNFKLSSIERDGHIIIKYLSKYVFVNLHYGPPSFELDFYFGRRGVEDRLNKHSFTSGDLLYLDVCEEWLGYTVFSAYSYDNLCECLPKLADLLKECGMACLKGEVSAYEKMLVEQGKDINRWHKSQELTEVRKAATKAWNNKNYAEIVKLFTPIYNDLTPSEYKKLKYSRKHQ